MKPKIDYDGLIVIDRVIKPLLHCISIPVIPPSFAKSIMLAAHLKLNHPKTTQFEKLVNRSFCSLKTKNLISDLVSNCFTCQADIVLPKEVPNYKNETNPDHPGSHWCCDILKHGKKNIRVSTDNFRHLPSQKY